MHTRIFIPTDGSDRGEVVNAEITGVTVSSPFIFLRLSDHKLKVRSIHGCQQSLETLNVLSGAPSPIKPTAWTAGDQLGTLPQASAGAALFGRAVLCAASTENDRPLILIFRQCRSKLTSRVRSIPEGHSYSPRFLKWFYLEVSRLSRP